MYVGFICPTGFVYPTQKGHSTDPISHPTLFPMVGTKDTPIRTMVLDTLPSGDVLKQYYRDNLAALVQEAASFGQDGYTLVIEYAQLFLFRKDNLPPEQTFVDFITQQIGAQPLHPEAVYRFTANEAYDQAYTPV